MKKLIFFFLFIAAIVFGWRFFSWYQDVYRPASETKETVVFTIESGQSIPAIDASLYEQGLLRKEGLFDSYVSFRDVGKGIISGTYELETNMSAVDIVNRFLLGPAPEEKTITLLEGWTNVDMDLYLSEEGILPAEGYADAVSELSFDDTFLSKYDFLEDKAENVDLEGYLFPDTYRIFQGASAQEIIQKQLSNFDRKLTQELRDEIASQGKTIFEIVTIASILEKEVQRPSDMADVADIIYKRLKVGMPLQMDSTVNYVTGRKRDRIYFVDREIDSPYNTYKYPGLPLGPIANPSIDAIRAAVYPTSNTYYYFLTDPSGNVYYASTHEGHVSNRQYLGN